MQSDITITDVQLRLQPGQGRIAYEPLVDRLALTLSSDAFEKIVQTGLTAMAGRLPVEVTLDSATLTDGGAEIVANVKKSILKADLRVRLEIANHDPATIRVRIAELNGPAWIPTQFVIENAMTVASSKPGFARVPGDDRAFDVNPAEVIASRNIPLKLATPGAWSIEAASVALSVRYATVS